MKGTVIKSTGSWYVVLDESGRQWECRLRGKIRLDGLRSTNPVAVGDKVEFEQETGKETGVIKKIETRNNVIVRKSVNLSKASHIIASNIDLAIIVATVAQPRTSTGFIDRFMVTAEAYHIPTALIFNKCDLYDEDQIGEMAELIEYYASIGYVSFGVSAKTGFKLDELKALMLGKTCLFSGHSGVGKSALVNALDPSLNLRIGAISDVHKKGMHTTTFAEMHRLGFGAWIVDTPGIKEFALYDMENETLAQRFPEMRDRMGGCRFANCTHTHEPGCAVKEAVEKGEIADWRYANYIRMYNNEDWSYGTDD
ncbi:MAG: ribosome small subunit-dependent GTPase A [Bacteroidales bacterium]|nr:ribosome small subunit-dependent GTPase A [Bacteroidales bacterium]